MLKSISPNKKRAVGKPKLACKRNYPQWEDVQLIYFIAHKVKKKLHSNKRHP